MRRAIPFLSIMVLACVPAYGDEPAFQGEWLQTSLGVVTFKLDGGALVATFAHPQFSPVKCSVRKKTAAVPNEEGPKPGEVKLTLNDSGRSFSGLYQLANGRRILWQGWRPDPDATRAEYGRFDGLWLTTIGLMELDQTGDKVKGKCAVRGTSKIEGTITGRQLDFRYQWFRPGKGWFDLSKDGKTFEGAAVGDGADQWYGWQGRMPEFRRHVPAPWRARSWMGPPRGCSPTASAPRKATRRAIPSDGRPSSSCTART